MIKISKKVRAVLYSILLRHLTDSKEFFWDLADRLRAETNYLYEMMPLLYALIISTKGNYIEALRNIKEGISIVHEKSRKENPSPIRTMSPKETSNGKSHLRLNCNNIENFIYNRGHAASLFIYAYSRIFISRSIFLAA